MGTTRDDIRRWLERGKDEGATHVIVMCDTFDYGDYPEYVMPGQDARKIVKKLDGKNMAKLVEVYNLSMDWEEQLAEFRAKNY